MTARGAAGGAGGPFTSWDTGLNLQGTHTLADNPSHPGADGAVFQTFWETDHRGMNHHQSRNWYEYVGDGPGSSYGADWLGFYHPDDREYLQNEWQKSLASDGEQPYEVEARIRRYDGQYRWFRVHALPLRSKEGAVVKWIGTCTDIHAAKSAGAISASLRADAEPRTRARVSLGRAFKSALRLGPLERRLFWIVFVALLPLALLSFAALLHTANVRKEEATRAAEDTIQNVLTALDSELNASIAALDVLAASPRLATLDLNAFHDEARSILRRRQNWLNVILADGHKQVMNARLEFGAPLPKVTNAAAITETIRTGRANVSDILFSRVMHEYAFAVHVPIVRDGRVTQVLTAAIDPESVRRILRNQQVPEGAVLTVLDRGQHCVARSRSHEDWIGKPPSATLQHIVANDHPGSWSVTTTLEGVPVYTVFERSATTHWMAAIGIPTATLDAPVRRSYLALGSSVLGSFVLGLLVAFITGRTITGPMRELEHAASAMAQGNPPTIPATELPEIRHAALALLSAHTEREKLLQREREALLLEQQARLAAESASKAKDEFLAMLGHELRNPLAAISNASQLLEHSQRAQSKNIADEAIAIVRRQISHLTRLTDDLLDAGRVMLGKISLDRQPLNFATVIESVNETLRNTGRLAQHSLSVTLEQVWIRADATRMDQIVANLLTNAVKYTPALGTITVTLAREDDYAVLRVKDTGVGLEPDLLPRVFDLFVQGERSLDRSQGGLGIGLALVRRLVELHGGSVEAKSEGAERGSEFIVRIPCVEPLAQRQSLNPPRAEQPSRTIVLIEDNADVRTGLKRFLDFAGHHVFEAEDGMRGLQLIREHRPQIAIVDIGLPSLDGYELARAVRSESLKVRLIAITGYGSQEDVQRGRDAGFDRYLVKPVDFVMLEQVIAER